MILTTSDEHAEATEVVKRIRVWTDTGLRHDDIAIFYRLNSLSRVLEDAFRRAAVPHRIARGVEFYNRKEIKDVLAYLKLIVNPRDDLACERIINVPARGIGATTLGRLRRFADANLQSLLEASRQAAQVSDLGKAGAGKVAKFAALIEELTAAADDGPVKAILETLLERTGLETDLKAHGSEDGGELANVAELISAAAEFDSHNPEGTLADYLHQVALVSDIDRFEGASGAVTLMTMHAAKGLEFPAVIIVGCERGLLPFHRALEGDGDAEEERRLCFVGMTRAKDHLLMSHARYRGIRGSRQRQIPSEFLSELAGEHVRHVDLTNPIENVADRARDNLFDPEDPWDQPEPDVNHDDDFYDPDLDEAGDAKPGSGIRQGARVRHPIFGIGRVEKIGRAGSYTRVVVDFYQNGRKTLILQFAKLELLR